MQESTGHCQCGAVGFVYDGAESWRGYCHCDSCRRATSSPVTAYLGVPHGHWRWTGARPKSWASSPGTHWLFCPDCGSHVAYDSDRQPDEIHFFAALLDRPETYRPEAHFHFEEHLPWLTIADDLPRHSG
jgi:hypothetical protein